DLVEPFAPVGVPGWPAGHFGVDRTDAEARLVEGRVAPRAVQKHRPFHFHTPNGPANLLCK
ncbi:MAG: hypothetical protein CL450_09265, partial [Acidimicrobiaceae bacterium]|nr:hypothetical protein [Acidimicrobiaceae bacterium]